MSSPSQPTTYGTFGRSLHWLVAVLVISAIVVGEFMIDLALFDPNKFWLYQFHKSLGFTVLAAMALRIIWRLTQGTPALPAGMPRLQQLAAHGAHLAFYILLVAMPLGGWAMVSASPIPIPTLLWGVIPVPHLPFISELPIAEKTAWYQLFMTLHGIGGKLAIGLIAIHVLAGLYHQFWMRDGLLGRMVPGLRGPASVLVALVGLVSMGASVPLAHAADAPKWTVDSALSTITFNATVSGQAVPGRIKTFTATIGFDPADPTTTAITVDMDLASITMGAAQADAMLQTADWFDTAAQPKATFKAMAGKKVSPDTFELSGELTIKGITQPVVLPFTLTLDGTAAKAKGTVSIDRNAFGIGKGDAAAAVGPEVTITIDLIAAKQG
jgi:cytochrome b561/polyisoprenoid-binding protein YceI